MLGRGEHVANAKAVVLLLNRKLTLSSEKLVYVRAILTKGRSCITNCLPLPKCGSINQPSTPLARGSAQLGIMEKQIHHSFSRGFEFDQSELLLNLS